MYSKTELTEIKYLIFSRYITQKVLWNGVELVECDKCWNWKHESFRLILKPLSSITDEDAKAMAMIINSVIPIDFIHKNEIGTDNKFDIIFIDSSLIKIYQDGSYSLYDDKYQARKLDIPDEYHAQIHQYLQLKGYALPQLVILNGKPITLSVEQQIESLIIETKN